MDSALQKLIETSRPPPRKGEFAMKLAAAFAVLARALARQF
jgi:hypothetical protein